jgi:hypothetical protein
MRQSRQSGPQERKVNANRNQIKERNVNQDGLEPSGINTETNVVAEAEMKNRRILKSLSFSCLVQGVPQGMYMERERKSRSGGGNVPTQSCLLYISSCRDLASIWQ